MNKIKYIVSLTMLFLISTACSKKDQFDLTDVPTKDKYQDNWINLEHKKLAGKKEGNRELYDQLTLDIYVPDYTPSKGKEVCEFYIEFFKPKANDVDKKMMLYIELWSERLKKGQLKGFEAEKKYYKGGVNYNYKSGEKFLDCYDE